MTNGNGAVELINKQQRVEMPGMDSTFENCTCCGKSIRYGNALIEINRITQQIDNIDGKGLVATVIDSDDLATLCSDCGNKNFMPSKLRKRLAELLGIDLPETHLVSPYKEFYTAPDPCDLCGCDINPGNAEVEFEILFGQVDWSDEINDGIITPSYAESLFTFCASCGNKMSTDRLNDAIRRVLVYADMSETDAFWDHDNYDNDDEDDDDWDVDEPETAPILGFYSKQYLPGLTASFGNIPEAMEYVVNNLIAAGHLYYVNIRGGWEVESSKESAFQVVTEKWSFDNKKLDMTIHLAFDKENNKTDELIKFMEFPLYKHFARYQIDGIPCFGFKCGTDVNLLNRIARLLLVEVFRYSTEAQIECNIFDGGPLDKMHHNYGAQKGNTTPAEPEIQQIPDEIKNDDVMAECDFCGANIHYGNACVRFSRGIQQLFKPEPNGEFEKILIDEDLMGVVCVSCGNMFQNFQEMRKQLGHFLEIEEIREYQPEGAAVSTEPSENDICDDCGKIISLGNAELVIEKSVIQLPDMAGKNEKTMACNELLGFCAWCAAGKHTRSYVRGAVQEMILEIGDTESAYRKMREADPENEETVGDNVAAEALQ